MYTSRLSCRQLFLSNIPNILSLLRIVLIIPSLYSLQKGYYSMGLSMIGLAFVTDFVDGKIARRTKTISFSGAILDPVADKFLVIALFAFFTLKGILNPVYFLISTTRDVAQLMSIPILLFWKNIKFKVRPALIAKIATAIKFLIIGALLIALINEYIKLEIYFKLILNSILIVSALLEFFILIGYLKRFRKIYNGTQDTFE